MQRHSLWAMPSADDAALFVPWIERFAAQVGAPLFTPHLTVLGDLPADSDDTIAATLAAYAPFTVTLVAVADSEARFRCIILTAARPSVIVDLHNALVDACGIAATEYEPHLSLLYAELPPPKRAALREQVDLPLPLTITVDAVAVVDTADDVAHWATRRHWDLC